ncbi:MAG: TetR family transcriptional regulator [Actinomycetaceae bacterium]|nr:TetR family transcriptional regulator [Actinomycetaceae bacterium]
MSTARSMKAEMTRARIVIAAASILRTEGPSAVTYRNVAKKAEMSTSASGYYFSSIEQLLTEAGRYNMRTWADRAGQIAEKAEKLSPDQVQKELFELLIQAALPIADPTLQRHFSQMLLAANSPEVSTAYGQGRYHLDLAIRTVLRTAGYSHVSPKLLLAVIDGAAFEAISEGRKIEPYICQMLELFFASYKPALPEHAK